MPPVPLAPANSTRMPVTVPFRSCEDMVVVLASLRLVVVTERSELSVIVEVLVVRLELSLFESFVERLALSLFELLVDRFDRSELSLLESAQLRLDRSELSVLVVVEVRVSMFPECDASVLELFELSTRELLELSVVELSDASVVFVVDVRVSVLFEPELSRLPERDESVGVDVEVEFEVLPELLLLLAAAPPREPVAPAASADAPLLPAVATCAVAAVERIAPRISAEAEAKSRFVIIFLRGITNGGWPSVNDNRTESDKLFSRYFASAWTKFRMLKVIQMESAFGISVSQRVCRR